MNRRIIKKKAKEYSTTTDWKHKTNLFKKYGYLWAKEAARRPEGSASLHAVYGRRHSAAPESLDLGDSGGAGALRAAPHDCSPDQGPWMSTLRPQAIDLSTLAANVVMCPSGWFALSVPSERLRDVARSLREQVEYELEETGDALAAPADGRAISAEELLTGQPQDVLVLSVDAGSCAVAVALLEVLGSRLVDGPRGILLAPEDIMSEIAFEAHNFWSLIGSNAWAYTEDRRAFDTELRLQGMREQTGLTDDAVIAMVDSGTLPSDPMFAEWLVLLRMGERLGP